MNLIWLISFFGFTRPPSLNSEIWWCTRLLGKPLALWGKEVVFSNGAGFKPWTSSIRRGCSIYSAHPSWTWSGSNWHQFPSTWAASDRCGHKIKWQIKSPKGWLPVVLRAVRQNRFKCSRALKSCETPQPFDANIKTNLTNLAKEKTKK